jgi:hypothetical protein
VPEPFTWLADSTNRTTQRQRMRMEQKVREVKYYGSTSSKIHGPFKTQSTEVCKMQVVRRRWDRLSSERVPTPPTSTMRGAGAREVPEDQRPWDRLSSERAPTPPTNTMHGAAVARRRCITRLLQCPPQQQQQQNRSADLEAVLRHRNPPRLCTPSQWSNLFTAPTSVRQHQQPHQHQANSATVATIRLRCIATSATATSATNAARTGTRGVRSKPTCVCQSPFTAPTLACQPHQANSATAAMMLPPCIATSATATSAMNAARTGTRGVRSKPTCVCHSPNTSQTVPTTAQPHQPHPCTAPTLVRQQLMQ